MYKDNTILIVGGAGFLGNELTSVLNQSGFNTIVADSKRRLDKYLVPQSGVEYVSLDWPEVNSLGNLKSVDCVIHLAWSSNPTSSMADVAEDANTNIIGTLKLLEYVSANKFKKFVFMSSGGTVYGNNNGENLQEGNRTDPISAYGISKLACEKYVYLYGRRYGFTPLSIRLGNPYGSYQMQGTPVGVIANFIGKIYRDEPIKLYGEGLAVRDYIYIDDFTLAMKKLLLADSVSGTYNLGSGTGVSVIDIIKTITKISQKSLDIEYCEERRGDVRSVVLDITRLEQDIGFKPMVSLEVGIRNLIAQMSDVHPVGQEIPIRAAG